MTDDDKPANGSAAKRRRRDFLHTAGVLIGSAITCCDMAAAEAEPLWEGRRFDFLPMAAAASSGEAASSQILARDGALAVTIETRDDAIWLRLQLKGFAALQQNAGQDARLVSANRAIDYRFRFGTDGGATCVLANEPAIKQGLTDFCVVIRAEADET